MTARRSAAVALAALVAIPAAASARELYATDDKGNLLRVDSQQPAVVLDEQRIVGLPTNVVLRGIDIRPATGGLFGLGSDAVLYRINAGTGVATAAGPPIAGGLTGTSFGFDFNPTVDRIRVVSEADQNLRIVPDSGALGVYDKTLNPGAPNVVGAAYRNSSITATRPTATELLVVDSTSDTLLTQNPPNEGVLVNPRPLGINIGNDVGFDIVNADEGLLAATPSGALGARLYIVNIVTGQTYLVGSIAGGRRTITGLAAAQNVGAPLGYNVAPVATARLKTFRAKGVVRTQVVPVTRDPDGRVVKIEIDLGANGSVERTGGPGIVLNIARRNGAPVLPSRRVLIRATDDSGARTTRIVYL
ncbi:MAG: DUF4394 domain-containing protein [Actinobacteria bacterium]|nr:DUF4394 domain-containing protein [Actinomycetota bacterium]